MNSALHSSFYECNGELQWNDEVCDSRWQEHEGTTPPVDNWCVASVNGQALPGHHVPLANGVVSTAREGSLVLQVAKGDVAFMS